VKLWSRNGRSFELILYEKEKIFFRVYSCKPKNNLLLGECQLWFMELELANKVCALKHNASKSDVYTSLINILDNIYIISFKYIVAENKLRVLNIDLFYECEWFSHIWYLCFSWIGIKSVLKSVTEACFLVWCGC